MGIVELLILIFFGVAVVALLWNVLRVFLPSRLPKVREPVCAKCRYSVVGLGDWRCPECGTDLRVGGILTPQLRQRARGSLAAGIVSWVVLMTLAGWVTAMIAVPRMVHEYQLQTSISESVVRLQPRSRAYREMQIVGVSTVSAEGWGTPETVVRIDNLGELKVGDAGLTPEVLLAWMSERGIDTSSGEVRREAEEAVRLLSMTESGRGMVSSSAFRGVMTHRATRATGPLVHRVDINPWLYAIGGAWLALFGGVIWLMIWARRRQKRSVGLIGDRKPEPSSDPSA